MSGEAAGVTEDNTIVDGKWKHTGYIKSKYILTSESYILLMKTKNMNNVQQSYNNIFTLFGDS